MMVELYILNRNYEQIDVLDSFKSLLWVKRYTQFGDCEIYISASERNVSLLQRGNFIRRDDDDMICRIVSVQIETDEELGNHLVVVGKDCRDILNQRIIWRQTTYKGTAEGFIRRIINENFIATPTLRSQRNIPNLKLRASNGFDDELNIQSSYEIVGEKVIEVCSTFGYGSRMLWDGENFIFELYKGTDRSYNQEENDYVVFSPDFENLASSNYAVDSSEYRTVALVGGQGEGADRVLTTYEVSDAVGIDRYEVFVDADSVSDSMSYEDLVEMYPGGTIEEVETDRFIYSVNGEPIALLDKGDEPSNATLNSMLYVQILSEKGRDALAEHVILTTFEGSVEPYASYKYGQDYFLGDIVTVRNEYGIETSARITEVIESFDENGYSLIPTFEYEEV